MNGGCARLIGPRTVTTSSRGRVRVVRNPLDVMARLREVVGGNGTSLRRGCTRLASLGPDPSYGQNTRMEASNEKLSPEMDLGGGKYVG
ncbi:hypothetical protein CRG98_035274 [Punica granatum]|uniref:Uncharacterized protein n=1 Tax=Punica granatum TaxID=22663 RepID=A0A2I0IKQ4_PUNGR|nr:hypothetical protein CRG98_035274 [Punica granatum]